MDKALIAYEEMFDYVELPLAQMMALSDADFRDAVLTPAKDHALCVAACNNFAPASLRLTGQEARLNEAAEYAKRALDRAAALGAGKVVFGSAGARNIPPYFSREDAEGQLAQFLFFLGEEAAARGIRIAIEPLNRLESNIVNSLREGVALALRAAHPAVGTLADSFHFNLGNEDWSYLQEQAASLTHVHLARTLGRTLPEGPDEGVDAFLQALKMGGYDGTMSLEAYCPEDFRVRSKRAMNRVRDEWARGEA